MADPNLSEPDFLDEEPGEEIDDDFLYHLYRGGELLRSNRAMEAKNHLEQAFTLRPTNPRGQNLLGLVYFKLGMYQRSIEIYRKLVERHAEDATLRVNLSMVYFKAEQLHETEQELRRAIELNPEHQNAHRYLGLVLVRKGETGEARRHFLLAGVKNIEQLIGKQSDEDVSKQRQEALQQAQVRTLAEVADQGFCELEEKEIPFRPAGPGHSPKSASPMADGAAGTAAAERRRQPMSVSLEDESWRAREVGRENPIVESDQAAGLFSIDQQLLVIRCADRAYCRLGTVNWIAGDLAFAPVQKRFGGQETTHPFNHGERTVVAVEGTGELCLAAPKGDVFHLLDHAGESGYFVEHLVIAFSDTPAWENGRLPSGKGADLPIFHLFGDAQLVVACPGRICRRRLDPARSVRLRVTRLVGWLGNLAPRLFEAKPPLPEELWIELAGVGEVLTIG